MTSEIKKIPIQSELEIQSLAYGGMGVGRIDGKVCFVEGALPGETVRFVRMSEKKRFIIGKITEVIKPSSERVKPICPYYYICGGCQYQHIRYEKEVFYKGEQVKDAFKRIGGFQELNFGGISRSEHEYGYRSSVTLHKTKEGYGYFAKDNKTIVMIDKCPLTNDRINKSIKALPNKGGKPNVTIKSGVGSDAKRSDIPQERFFKDNFMGKTLTFSPLCFSQVNKNVAENIALKLRSLFKDKSRSTLFDLYCGVGFFGTLLNDLFKEAIGVDESRIAIECAESTRQELELDNIKFFCDEAEKGFSGCYDKMKGSRNTVIIDPPRTGMSSTVISLLAGTKDLDTIAYISCDPATLARDCRILNEDHGWHLDSVSSFDMFPRTKHIESLALLKKR